MDVAPPCPLPAQQLPPFASLPQIGSGGPFDCLRPPTEVLLEIHVRNFINEFLFSDGDARDVGIAHHTKEGGLQPDSELRKASDGHARNENAGTVGLHQNAQCGSLAEADAYSTVSTYVEAEEQETVSPSHSVGHGLNDENLASVFKEAEFPTNVGEKRRPNSCEMEEVILDVKVEESFLGVEGPVWERDASSVLPMAQSDKSASEAVRRIFCKAWNFFQHSESVKPVFDSTCRSALPLYGKVKDIPTFDGLDDQAGSFDSQHRRIERSSCSVDLQERQNTSLSALYVQKSGGRLPLAGQANKPSNSKKPPRPSRSSRLPSDPSQTGLKRCISDTSLAQISKRNERTKSRRRKLASSYSNSTSLWALIVTICFAIIMVAQGIVSQGNRSINDTVETAKERIGAPVYGLNSDAVGLSPVIKDITDHIMKDRAPVKDHQAVERTISVS